MGFNCGIVGLPNVGKSTLFNALTASAAAAAANFPFCTIEPNIGRVPVPDSRLDRISAISASAKTTPTYLDIVDIAGLVAGASRGEGLGNRFLAHIREVDAILQVLRCFSDGDVSHVAGGTDPMRDAAIIETELLLADLESLERRQATLIKRARGPDAEAKALLSLVDRVLAALADGRPARSVPVSRDEAAGIHGLQLLTSKPLLYVCNVDEADAATGNEMTESVRSAAASEGAESVIVSAKIEAEVAELPVDERAGFLEGLGLSESGLTQVIGAGYRLLDLITYFTAGPKESRAWTVRRGTKAPAAAGVIHSDFERGFIRAETISFEDFVALGGEQGARDAGRMRSEGRDYVVEDGDILLFRFNV